MSNSDFGGAPAFDLERVEAFIAEHRDHFGPMFSSGVAAIMLHESLPERFNILDWQDWFFKPSPAAFQWARTRGMLKLHRGGMWSFTLDGAEAARRFKLANTPTEVQP